MDLFINFYFSNYNNFFRFWVGLRNQQLQLLLETWEQNSKFKIFFKINFLITFFRQQLRQNSKFLQNLL
jgi:hypothetical protein